MEILNSIVNEIKEDAPIKEVRRGINWTAVVSRRCGLASTVAVGGCCSGDTAATDRPFTEMTALELTRNCFLRGDLGSVSLGLAALNSLIGIEPDKFSDVDGLQLIKEVGKGKNISINRSLPVP
jgi:uncharacterized protein (DUF4213/DUF364 family)